MLVIKICFFRNPNNAKLPRLSSSTILYLRKCTQTHSVISRRYWAVTNIDYIHHRTGRRIGMMIAVVWFVAALVCSAPLLGWKDPQWEKRVVQDKSCIVSQDVYYQVRTGVIRVDIRDFKFGNSTVMVEYLLCTVIYY